MFVVGLVALHCTDFHVNTGILKQALFALASIITLCGFLISIFDGHLKTFAAISKLYVDRCGLYMLTISLFAVYAHELTY